MSSIQLSFCCSCYVFSQYFGYFSFAKRSGSLPSSTALTNYCNLVPRAYRLPSLSPAFIVYYWRHVFRYNKRLPNFVNASCLCSSPEIWANQKTDKNVKCLLFQQVASKNPNEDSYLLAIPSREQLRSMLSYMLDEDEFLSPYGIRSVSRYHEKHPYELNLDGTTYKVDYVPGESNTHMFGGNSNWRGPIWHCSKY